MTEVFLHVGFPKTGTTFLQEVCFPHLKGVHAVIQRYPSPPTGMIKRLWRLAEAYPLFIDMDENRAEVNRFVEGITDGKLLISSERLVGDILWTFHDHVRVTDGLHDLFPSARIILTIRRQDDFLESLYRMYVKSYFYPTIDGFLCYTDGQFRDWIRPPLVFPSINVWRLNYHVYAQNYAAAFGRKNVTVLPYELLRDDPERFHTALAEFMAIEPYFPRDSTIVNRGYSRLSCRIALALNRFVRDPQWESRPWRVIPHHPLTGYLSRIDRHGPAHRTFDAINRRLSLQYALENVDRIHYSRGNIIDDEKRRLILEIHRDSNRRLDEEYGLGLRQYGYY